MNALPVPWAHSTGVTTGVHLLVLGRCPGACARHQGWQHLQVWGTGSQLVPGCRALQGALTQRLHQPAFLQPPNSSLWSALQTLLLLRAQTILLLRLGLYQLEQLRSCTAPVGNFHPDFHGGELFRITQKYQQESTF